MRDTIAVPGSRPLLLKRMTMPKGILYQIEPCMGLGCPGFSFCSVSLNITHLVSDDKSYDMPYRYVLVSYRTTSCRTYLRFYVPRLYPFGCQRVRFISVNPKGY